MVLIEAPNGIAAAFAFNRTHSAYNLITLAGLKELGVGVGDFTLFTVEWRRTKTCRGPRTIISKIAIYLYFRVSKLRVRGLTLQPAWRVLFHVVRAFPPGLSCNVLLGNQYANSYCVFRPSGVIRNAPVVTTKG